MEFPDYNLFMMCGEMNRGAFRPIPEGFHVRACRPDELGLWKRIHFDRPETADAFAPFMDDFFDRVYRARSDLFFERCRFICDAEDVPLGTCFLWEVYGGYTTLHWFKVERSHEDRGLGRALLSHVLGEYARPGEPIYLHTQPSSFRAIHLYSDFGFELLTDAEAGGRPNHWRESLPLLERAMPEAAFRSIRLARSDGRFFEAAARAGAPQF